MEEIQRRAAIFFEKDKYINERNAKEKGSRIVVSHNKFSDWTIDEYRGILKSKGTVKASRDKAIEGGRKPDMHNELMEVNPMFLQRKEL